MKLGEILIQQKILTLLLVTRVLRISNDTHRRFGQTLEDLGRALAAGKGYAPRRKGPINLDMGPGGL